MNTSHPAPAGYRWGIERQTYRPSGLALRCEATGDIVARIYYIQPDRWRASGRVLDTITAGAEGVDGLYFTAQETAVKWVNREV